MRGKKKNFNALFLNAPSFFEKMGRKKKKICFLGGGKISKNP